MEQPKSISLADHCDAWLRESGRSVPARDTEDYEKVYTEWIEFAFKDFCVDKLTFKKQPKITGLAGIGYPYTNVDIKHKKQNVGIIYAPTWQKQKWSIAFAIIKIEDGNENCSWRWWFLKKEFDSEQEARDWVKNNTLQIMGLDLHHFED